VEENNQKQLQMASERAIMEKQRRDKEASQLKEESVTKDKKNRISAARKVIIEHNLEQTAQEAITNIERRECVEKIKDELQRKKVVAKKLRASHVVTKRILEEFNPYAAAISKESIATAKLHASRRLISSS